MYKKHERIVKCERCGKTYTRHYEIHENNGVPKIFIESERCTESGWEVCDKCIEEFYHFMNDPMIEIQKKKQIKRRTLSIYNQMNKSSHLNQQTNGRYTIVTSMHDDTGFTLPDTTNWYVIDTTTDNDAMTLFRQYLLTEYDNDLTDKCKEEIYSRIGIYTLSECAVEVDGYY